MRPLPRLRCCFTHRLACAFASLLACAAANAQLPQAAPPTTTLQATTRIVYVDVVVRDGFGHIVHGLPQSRFQISEDKQPQHISLFQEHTGHDAPVPPEPAAPRMISNVPQAQRDSPLDMILLDLLDTSPQDQAFARIRMINFLRALPAGRRVALFVLSNQLHMIQGFTSDSAALAQAAQAIDIRQMNRLRTPGQQVRDNDEVGEIDFATGGPWGGGGHGFLTSAILSALDQQDRNNMKVRLDAAFTAFRELSRAVNGIPGRKNLYWLAGEFPSDTYYTLQNLSSNVSAPVAGGLSLQGSQGNQAAQPLGSTSTGIGPGSGGLDASSDLTLHPFGERFNRVVGDSQIAVYPINLVGVQTDNVSAEDSGIGSTLGSEPDTAATFFNERTNDKIAMHRIADDTGGEAFYGNNDPAGMLRRGFEDGENYYTIAYRPTNRDYNSAYRKIEVALQPRGYHLAYRRGYFALPVQPAGQPIVEFASAMRLETPPSTMLTVSALPPNEVATGVMRLDATLHLEGVSFASDAAGERRAKLQILLIAYPLDPGLKPAEINNVLSLGLTPQDYQQVLASGLPLRQTLHLKPGRYAIRFGVLDPLSGRIGTLTLPFQMPAS